jgi:hypothetical protein
MLEEFKEDKLHPDTHNNFQDDFDFTDPVTP